MLSTETTDRRARVLDASRRGIMLVKPPAESTELCSCGEPIIDTGVMKRCASRCSASQRTIAR